MDGKDAAVPVPPDAMDTSDCKVCDEIWSALVGCARNSTVFVAVNVGSFEEALSSPCSRHRPLVVWFRDFGIQMHRSYDKSRDVGICVNRRAALTLIESIKHGGMIAEFCLVKKESVEEHPGVARILNSEWIDTTIVDRWLGRCKSSHGGSCENPMKIWRTRPAWVVDTETKRLIPGEKCDSFVALSYRWGRASRLHISGDIITKLQKPYALEDPSVSSQLAPMVQHAIGLTRVIGHRYLWVDTLCIDHSRVAESVRELQSMGAIYANATLTIVALDGDAQDGFPGLRGISPSKKSDNGRYVPFGGELFVHENDLMEVSPYHKRGWTYQEFHMSPRRLIFSNNSLHWFCQRSVWEEHLYEANKDLEPYLGEIMRGMPNLDSLSMLIQDYNKCELAFDEDALPKITGLLTAFSRSFSGGFLCGIPEMLFEAALSWKPYWKHTDLRRRTPSNRPESSRLRPCHLPSWSWIGWQVPVDIGTKEAGPVQIRDTCIRETIPITIWYASNSPKLLDKRKI